MELNEQSSLDRVMAILGYNFEKPSLLSEALHVAGSCLISQDGRLLSQGNKPLANIGDRVLTLYIADTGYDQGLTTGMTSDNLQKRVSNSALAEIFNKFPLEVELVKNPSQPGMASPKTKATTVEAIVGAVYRDGGSKAAFTVVETLGI